MDFRDFERCARRAFEDIPDAFREGVDGLTVRREAMRHPTLQDVYTLGQCVTEEHPSDYGSPDTTRSVIALYWGSFRALAELNPDFDWDAEIWRTITHELRHHLESLAGDDALEDMDFATDELYKRLDGLAFDPWYYQRGQSLGEGVYSVEEHHYIEQVWRASDFERARRIELDWRGSTYRVPRPEELGDVHFVRLRGPDFRDHVELVLVRRRHWWESFAHAAGASVPWVLESAAEAERVRGD